MHQVHDPHAHRNPDVEEAPLDAASQSLADALKASFGILKGIMLILVVLYLVSNVRGISSHEQALILRMGKLQPFVRDAGLVWAFPFPIDEIVRLPTRQSNELTVKSHTFHRRREEVGKPLSFITRGHRGLNPSLDGALLTADAGLVHVQWKITYKIDDVRTYVSTIAGKEVEAAQRLIQIMVETAGIELAGELTAEEFIRTDVDHAQGEMLRRVNQRLRAIDSGITVSTVEMFEPTPPIQVRAAFDRTQQAENEKEKRIRHARQGRTKILNEAAGAVFPQLTELIDELERNPGSDVRARLDRILLIAEGQAGQMIKDVGAYLSVEMGRIQADVEEYRTLVPEYERSPALLVERLWEQTRQRIFANPNVVKIYRPNGLQEMRIAVGRDPEQAQAEEVRRLQDQKFDATRLQPQRMHPVGPEFD